jgi:hypothetical protein
VDIHVATPYGVSSHLAIPLNCCSTTCQPTTPKSGFAWDPLPQELIGYIEYEDKTDAGKVKEFHFEDSAANPKKLTIKDSSDIPDAAKVKEAVLVLRLTGAAPAGQNKPFDSTKQLPVTFSDGHFDLLLSALQGLVGDVLKQNLGQSQGLTEISVNAYILPGDGKYDGATPLSNVLKIKLLPPKAATAPK